MDDYIEINTKYMTYKSGFIKLNNLKIIYADYIASGKPSPLVENYLIEKIYPYYSNTHSNANNGIFIKKKIEKVKKYIKNTFNLSNEYKIIFTGNGTTGAINHLVNSINYTKFNKVYIFISNYEHLSNYLPWLELHKEFLIIPFDENNLLDINWFENKIKDIYKKKENNTLIITSIIHCSNVNGLFLPIEKIKFILNSYNDNTITKYFFCDLACSAPYVNIDGSIFDAFFISPHKFIGGTSTPGILIAKEILFTNNKPFCPGGGCVLNVSNNIVTYKNEIEKKETAGTPNIIGIIRIEKAFKIKNIFQNIITTNEIILSKLIKKTIIYLENKYCNFKSILYDTNNNEHFLPILSFYIKNLHYNLIVKLFNDLFGIQTRGGIACCNLLAEHLKKKYDIDGFCRISFHWLMNKKTIKKIINALEFIIKNGHKYISFYKYNKDENLFYLI